MKRSTWGLCKTCEWWQIEPQTKAQNATLGLCIDDKMQRFLLRVSGNSGCNRYMKGIPAHAGGSAAAPPRAKPIR